MRVFIVIVIVAISILLSDIAHCQTPSGREPLEMGKGYLVWKGGRYQYQECVHCASTLVYSPSKRIRRSRRVVRVNRAKYRADAEMYSLREYRHVLP